MIYVKTILCVQLVLGVDAFTFTPTCPLRQSSPQILTQSGKQILSRSSLSNQSKDESDISTSKLSINETSRRLSPKARRPSVESGLRYRSDDWIGNLISIPNSFLLRRIRFHLLSNSIVTAVVVMLNRFGYNIKIPLVGHTLLGSFLGLLLVFRTNSAYARFWEARGVWTKASTTCRSMALSIVNYMNDHSPVSAKRLMKLLFYFPDALAYKCLPSDFSVISTQIEQLLGKENLEKTAPMNLLLHHMHKVIHEASLESTSYQSNYVEAMHLVEISHMIGSLSDSVSNADKILKTPVPLSYSRHTSRCLTIWSGTLPLALVGQLGLITLPVMVIASWCLYGIEEIGHLIEQPFVGDQTSGEAPYPNSSIFAIFPLIRRASYTQPYDIGLPVENLAALVKEEIKGVADIVGMVL